MVDTPGFPATLNRMEKQQTLSVPRTAGLLLVAAVWALFLSVTGSPEAVLFTLPVFLLAAPLAFGRYAGEELLLALNRKRTVVGGNLGLSASWPEALTGPGRLEGLLLPGRSPPALTA
jgi:hypothetical protein